MTVSEAKKMLQEGNQRFISGQLSLKDVGSQKRAILAEGQSPFAAIVACSDSRTPPELIFDFGLGDIFVTRTAGNVVGELEVGSLEYAAEHLHAPLIVVLGHDKCGAVGAAVEGGHTPGSIGSLVKKIAPSVEKAKAQGVTGEELVELAADLNIRVVVEEIKQSPVIDELIHEGKLEVIGAKYDLASGKVAWF